MSIQQHSPFHEGEQLLQSRVGKREKVEALGQRVIRDYLPQQHQMFYAGLNMLVLGGLDPDGHPWVLPVLGEPGFVRALDDRHLSIESNGLDVQSFERNLGSAIGVLGIDLATRRRNRVNGRVVDVSALGFVLEVEQSFGNCPQYIQVRSLQDSPRQPSASDTVDFDAEARALIAQADTLFVSSFMRDSTGSAHVDVSHRGGSPGFIQIADHQITVPDYKGNNHFNTLGNFVLNPVAGVTIPDFRRGRLLQMTGTVELLESSNLEDAERAWRFTPDQSRWINEGIHKERGEI